MSNGNGNDREALARAAARAQRSGAVEKMMPQNIEAEAGVLGSLLIDPGAIFLVTDIVRPEDFYREAHREIYRAALDMSQSGDPADLITLTDELQRRGKLEEIGGVSYVSSLANQVPTSANAEYYAGIVARCGYLRRLIQAAGQIAAVAYSEPDAEVARAEAEKLLTEAAKGVTTSGPVTLSAILAAELEAMSAVEKAMAEKGTRLLGVPTGLSDLDRVTGGLQKSDLIILAARPAVGKTSLALGLARAAAVARMRTLFFSLEMSKEQLGRRMLSMQSGVDQQRLRQNMLSSADWDAISNATGELDGLPLEIDDTPGATLSHVRGAAKRMAANGGLDVIFIDYLQLMQGEGGARRGDPNRQQEISEISRGLKALARELNVPVVALSQLSREVEKRVDKRPQLSDLRESGALEQDADIVMFIYREEVYNPDTDTPNLAQLIIAKHRNGPLATIQLYFQKETTLYRALELRYASDEPGSLPAPSSRTSWRPAPGFGDDYDRDDDDE